MHRPTIATLFVFVVIASIPSVSTPARAADSCQVVFDALTKVVTTPSHSYTTHTAAFLKGGKPQSSETIYADGADGKVYIRVNGKWMVSPVEPKDILERQKEKREHGKATCQFMRNEFVGAEAAAVYSMHSENEGDKEDAQMWISKSTGLLLRSEQDVNVGGVAGKEHRSARFEYGNIRPPM
jgi:hypothetical protein